MVFVTHSASDGVACISLVVSNCTCACVANRGQYRLADPRCPDNNYIVRLRDLREAVLRTDVNQSRPWMHDIRIDALQLLDELAVGVRVYKSSDPFGTPDLGRSGSASDSPKRGFTTDDSPIAPRVQSRVQQLRSTAAGVARRRDNTGGGGGGVGVDSDGKVPSRDAAPLQPQPRVVRVVPFSKLFTRHAVDGSANAVIVVLEMYARQCAWVKSPKARSWR